VNVLNFAAVPGAPVKLTVGVSFAAVVDCVTVFAEYVVLLAHAALVLHVPVPINISTVAVTVVPLVVMPVIVHVAGVVAVTTGTLVSLVDEAVTVKLLLYASVVGAPVKLTVGTTGAATFVVSTTAVAAL
jgi:hypothetical protein